MPRLRKEKKSKPYIKPPQKQKNSTEVSEPSFQNEIEDVKTENNPVASTSESLTVTENKEVSTDTPIQLDLSAQGVSGLSISSLRVQKEHQNKVSEATTTEKINEKEVNQEDLAEQWKTFTEQMTKKGERNMLALLQLDEPRLKHKTEIHITVPNQTNKVELEKNSSPLLRFLREQLSNDHLNMVIHVDVKEEKKFVYTSEDKYKELVAKNAIVEDFKKNFNLDY